MRVFDVVNGRATVGALLNVTSASRSLGFRRAAKARAAAIAARIGAPSMLWLASTITTAPKVVPPAALAGETFKSTTEWPFSDTWTALADRERSPGRLRTNDRSGNFAPPASVSERWDPLPAPEAARGS